MDDDPTGIRWINSDLIGLKHKMKNKKKKINCMSLAVWLGEERKCSVTVVSLDLDLVLGLSMVRRCSFNRSLN